MMRYYGWYVYVYVYAHVLCVCVCVLCVGNSVPIGLVVWYLPRAAVHGRRAAFVCDLLCVAFCR